MPNNNNNNGNNPLGHNINFSDAPEVQSGLGGYFTGNAARNEFSNKFWDDQNGYLATVTKELDNMLKQYRELAKYSDQMTKSERQAVRARQAALREEAKVLKNIKDQQDVSAEAASGVIKEATNLLTNSQAGLAKGWNVLQDKTDKALENVEKASNHYTKLKDDFTKMNKEMGNLVDTANKASESFASSLSTTLKNAGDRLANLSNMFSLQKIANNTAEQNARSIEKIQSDTMKQFGFTSNSQYWNFVDSLNNNLKSMNSSTGNLFNTDDLKQYMSNLGAFGITDTKMAQQQMKNSVIATKYLGVTAETQQLMFKYMKRTNNNDTIEKHNQMIVGLLQSQLGVSKEQLDVLSQKTYEDAEALAMLGVDQATQEKYIQEATASKAAMDSIAAGWGDVLGKVFNEMIAMPYEQMVQKYGKLFGSDVNSIYEQLMQGNAVNATRMIAGNSQLRSLASGSDTRSVNATLNALGVGDQAGFVNMMRYFGNSGGMSTLDNKLDEAIQAIRETGSGDVENFVEKSTEATLLERIHNWLDTHFGTSLWKVYPYLANAAFGAYIASDILKGGKWIIDTFKNGKLFTKFSNFLGGASGSGTALSGAIGKFAMGGLAVGLTAAAVAGLAKVTTESVTKAMQISEDQKNYTKNKLKSEGNPMAGDSAYVGAYAKATNLSKRNGWDDFWGTAANVTSGWVNNFNKSDPDKYNTELWNNFMRGSGGMFSQDELLAMEYMYTVLMNNAGTPGVAQSLFGLSKDDVKKYLKNESNAESKLKTAFNKYDTVFIDNWGAKWPRDYDGHEYNSLDLSGYHKAGKDYIPRDNYRALLHKGEMVLNAQEADIYRQMFPRGGDSDTKPRPKGRIITGLPWPMTAGYPSYPSGGQHRGLDFGIPIGTKVGAATAGTIVTAYTGDNYNTYKEGRRVFGQYILMKGNNGLYYRYGHLSKVGVKAGQQVAAGDTIGLSGNTGYSTGPHLHFQVQRNTANSSDISPYNYITSALFQAKGDINMPNDTKGSNNTIASGQNSIPIRTTKFIPKALQFSTDGGVGGMEESVSKGVNSGIDKLIGYLEGIRSEQNDQRRILEAFSKSRISEPTY